MPEWKIAPAGSRRQAFRRRFDSISSRLLHRTILDFRLRLVLLAALTLPFILLGGCVHALASGHPWSTSAYLVYGLLFRVPALGAVRLDEPTSSALVLNAVFLFGTFGFAILLGLIGEEVKGTVKALRAGGTPLDLNGHILLLNFTADATAVALLHQVAQDVGRQGSPLYGRPVVVLASQPPPAGPSSALGAAGGGGVERAGGGGGGGGDLEGTMKRVVADALQGCRGCEWHLRIGSSCRTDDLARVCAATASYIVLLADPRAARSADATAAGAASCLQAQALMCLSLAMAAAAEQTGGTGAGQGAGAGAGGRGRPAAGGTSRAAPSPWVGGGGGGTTLRVSRQQTAATIVVQAPADAPPAPGAPGGPGLGGGPIATFRAVAAAEGSRPAVIEVCDRGIVDRLVAQTVLQPGVATVLARLFGGSGDQGSGFRWLEWPGLAPAGPSTAAAAAAGRPPAAAAAAGDSPPPLGPSTSKGEGSLRLGGGGGGADLTAVGLRRRRILAIPRTLSYNISVRPLAAATASGVSAGKAVPAAAAAAASGSADGKDGGNDTAGNGRWLAFAISTLFAPLLGRRTADSVAAPAPTAAAPEVVAASSPDKSSLRPGVDKAKPSPPLAPATGRPKAPPLLVTTAACNGGGTTSTSTTTTRNSTAFGDVRAALEMAVASAADVDAPSSRWRRQQQPCPASPGSSPAGDGGGAALRSLTSLWWPRGPFGSVPVLVGYMSAATGTLRLNPKDASPVYPGDKLVLLVSEDPMGAVSRSAGGRQGRRTSSSSSGCGWGDGARGGWAVWRRHRQSSSAAAAGEAVAATAAAATLPSAAQMCGGTTRMRRSTAGGPRLLFCGSDTTAAAVAALRSEAAAAAPPRPVPLQGWHSGPAEQPDDWSPSSPSRGIAAAASGFSAPAFELLSTATKSGGKHRPAGIPATVHEVTLGPGKAAIGDGGGGGGGMRGNGQTPARARRAPRTPAAPPSHIIVISRTAAAVREVVAGLQEFAPAGSTITLVTHGSDGAAPPLRASAGVAAGAGARSSGGVNPPMVSAASSGASISSAFAGDGNGDTVVLPCTATSWPVSEADMVLAGLAVATAVLVARDGGLQPHEADATALSAVLQLHQTLTDPTRSPLRRSSPRPRPWGATNGDGGAAAADLPPPSGTVAEVPAGTEAVAVVAAEGLPEDRSAQPPTGCGTATTASSVAAAAAATAAAVAVAATTAAADGPAPPLHVVVCLHSTRSRETLRRFLGGLNAQPPFTLEALVPEEYRALLLAGVVRQPQSHAIMTELLSDRPGSPEVYLLPPARLLGVAAAAAAAQGGCGDAPPAASPPTPPESPPASAPPPGTAHPDVTPTPTPGASSDAPSPDQPQPALSPQAVNTTTLVRQASLQPQLPHPGPVLSGWRFRDVARVARACGCTAIGVLRGDGGGGSGSGDAAAVGELSEPLGQLAGCGGGGGGGSGGGGGGVRRLHLAPNPDAELDLAADDRLVVLAADPV